jgi:nucleotide-binding universal stress UspA family protein
VNAPVVVGYDQTPHSRRALDVGIREAVARGTGLQIVHAYTFAEPITAGLHATATPPAGGLEQTNRRDAEEILAEAADGIRARHPGLPVRTCAVPGYAPTAIIDASGDAGLLVVGSRGRGGFTGLLLGSTSQRVLADARCPVVVVREAPSETRDRILVGIDVDDPSDTVLEFAFDTTARHRSRLVVVSAWDEPWTTVYAAAVGTASGPARERERADRLKEILEPWRDKYPGVHVTTRLYSTTAYGTAGFCLVQASSAADLLVIGAVTSGGDRHANRLGPVAHTTVHHAHCPVAVVPDGRGRR